MKKLLLTTAALAMMVSPAFAKDFTVKQVSDPAGDKPYYFSPSNLTIQPGDTVTFVNVQDDMHDVMFVEVPKGVDEIIMSPMSEKEGDKFSYTFTVPGTYKFHCHPHEALGMEGTLIVGQASKPGETVKMDHHNMGKKTDTAKTAPVKGIPATGIVNSIDVAGGTLNITHDPIKVLNWPKMKMVFTAEKGVDLSAIKAGDSVTFTLKDVGGDDYTVSSIQKK